MSLLIDVYDFAWSSLAGFALLLCVIFAPLGRWWDDFAKEFLGTMVMILTQCSAGKWWGVNSWYESAACHAIGVVIADWSCGGPNVNPSVAFTMVALGELEYPRFLCRVAAELAAGILTFPLGHWIALSFGMPDLGGPLLDHERVPLHEAALHEFAATASLCLAIYLLCWELPVRKVYLVKQALIALWIRFNLETFTAAGCAMNPIMGTGFHFWAERHKTGVYTLTFRMEDFLCFWVASMAGGLLMAALYALIKGVPFFGVHLCRTRTAKSKTH